MNRNLFNVLLLMLCMAFVACSTEDMSFGRKGSLQLSLGNILSETRSTPSELGVPLATQFNVRAVNAYGNTIYNGPFTGEDLTINIGDYTLVAEYGENPVIGYDKPYYVGSATATVAEDETTSVTIPCSVGNALVSVAFGADEETLNRFNRFYSLFALRVTVGNNSMDITNFIADRSIYVRAGSTVQLSFVGTLAANGERVSKTLTLPDGVSSTLNAADHLKLTLTLPEPENALVVNIEKAEVEQVSIEETIPYEWLPAPTVTPTHQYDADGYLVGTNLALAAVYPEWTAEIHRGTVDGEIVRTVSGNGDLTSLYTDSEKWPYLPAGTYVASFSYQTLKGNTYHSTKTRTFTVPSPDALKTTISGITSYSAYLKSGKNAANSCGGTSVHDYTAKILVGDNIVNNFTNTVYQDILNETSFTAKIDNITLSGAVNGVEFTLSEKSGLSFGVHTGYASGTFDGGTSTTASQEFIITGLPYTANSAADFNAWILPSPAHGEWSADGECPDGMNSMAGNKAGEPCFYFAGESHNIMSSNVAYANIYTPQFYIPSDINITLGYHLWIYGPSAGMQEIPLIGTLVGSAEMLYCNYGPVASTSETPSSATAQHSEVAEWSTETNNFTLTTANTYLSWEWHYDGKSVGSLNFNGFYWWAINDVSILYR